MRYFFITFSLMLAFPSLSETISTDIKTTDTVKITRFSQQLGLATINIPAQLSTPVITHLSRFDETKNNVVNYQGNYNRAGYWLYSNHNKNVWIGQLTTNNESNDNINHDLPPSPQGLNAALNYGRFSMETALLTENNNLNDSGQFYVQGAYTVIEKSSFNLSITAKVETLSEDKVNDYLGYQYHSKDGQSLMKYQAKNTTLGVVGTYEITAKWTVMGAFTSTLLDKDIMQSPLVNEHNVNMALIGTSYSF
ncbi:MipA/OmpV family protein [Thalassotalea piscium]